VKIAEAFCSIQFIVSIVSNQNKVYTYNVTLKLSLRKKGYVFKLNCPIWVRINQTFQCSVTALSQNESFSIQIDFGDGDIRAMNLSNSSISISKTYTTLGVYEINGLATFPGFNITVNPVISVTKILAYDNENLVLNCSSDKVISLTNIYYGSLQASCNDSQASLKFRNHCNNKTTCSITVGSVPTLTSNCVGLIRYLFLDYDCKGKIRKKNV
jgi:hypothetical protein